MRYYDIRVFPPATSSAPNRVWSSLAPSGKVVTSFNGATATAVAAPSGKSDPGALQVEFDILASFLGIPGGDVGSSTITIHGVPLSDLQQAQNWYGSTIAVRGGMQAGLPLAAPQQAGLLIQGVIYQAFGNWIGDDMNLSFVVVPSGNTLDSPGNFSFVWEKGQALSTAIQNTLQVVYPASTYKIRMNIANTYATAQPIANKSSTLTEFAQFINSLTNSAVNISFWNYATLLVTDNSVQTNMVHLSFTDLIGQPKWVNPNTMQFMTVMRADIQVGTTIKMPQGLLYAPGTVTTTAASAPSQLKYKTAFQGIFTVQSVRHVGNFRDPDGASWASIFEAVANAQ